ncbi:MAG TPA: hypothetical protein VF858_08040 [Gemmatimonadaceae bacterium]
MPRRRDEIAPRVNLRSLALLWSTVVYTGLVVAAVGLIFVIRPIERLHVTTRWRGLAIIGIGVVLVVIGLNAPVTESRADKVETRLDEFVPVWQFSERHTINVAASPERVFDAIKRVRANDIAFFKTLTWIRRGGRKLPESILNASDTASLLDVATRSGFIYLVNDAPRELVVGTMVIVPRGGRVPLTPETFKTSLSPGYALAAMNFVVKSEGPNASIVSTETRVFANSPESRRRFARYWRVIYPGSAIIRRMWLRAVRKRAMTSVSRIGLTYQSESQPKIEEERQSEGDQHETRR